MSTEGEEQEKPSTRHVLRDTLRGVRHGLAPLGRRRVLGGAALLFGGAVTVVIVLTGFSMWWTSRPSFCARCHPMEPFVAAWQASSHKNVNCERCHTSPGLFGFLGGKIAGLQVVANYARGNYHDYSFNAVVPNGSCLECHEKMLTKPFHASTNGVEVVVSHKNIVEAGGKCISCHSTVAHGNAVPAGAQTHPTMAACLKCHNDKIAPLRCNLCHPARVPTPGAAPQPAALGEPAYSVQGGG